MTARLATLALVPFAALGAPLSAGVATARAKPEGRFSLERVLTRELGDGAAIVVTRRWQIGFEAARAGFIVNGEQTFADVASPAALAALAAMEKARSTRHLFPLALDRAGHITSGKENRSAADIMRAIEAAQAVIDRDAEGAARSAQSRAFMAEMSRLSATVVSTIPRDLFFPSPKRSTVSRAIALPNGARGEIEVTSQASTHADTGLLEASERSVVTRVAGTARAAREAWTLTQTA